MESNRERNKSLDLQPVTFSSSVVLEWCALGKETLRHDLTVCRSGVQQDQRPVVKARTAELLEEHGEVLCLWTRQRFCTWTRKAWSRKEMDRNLDVLKIKDFVLQKIPSKEKKKPQVERKYFQIMYLIMVSVPLYIIYIKNFCNLIVR